MNALSKIDEIISNRTECFSILVKDIESGEYIYKYNSDFKFVSASLIKVPIMIYVLELVKQNKIKLEDKILVKKEDIINDTEVFENKEKYYTIEELITWIIIKSDNTSTNVIIKRLGLKNIELYIREALCLKSTSLERYMCDYLKIEKGYNNYTSQDDMCELFNNLFNKKILTENLCALALDILKRQRCQDQVMRYIYEPITYFHKTGSLDNLNHDCGIMMINDRPYYIGISIWNCKNSPNKKLVGKIGRIVFEYLSDKGL